MRRLTILGLLLALAACANPGAAGQQRYAVFFQEWSAALDQPAKDVVAQAASWANTHPAAEVHVIGYADPEGSPQANRDLSRTRAQVVADGLAADGVAAQRVHIEGAGSVAYAMDFAGSPPGDDLARQPVSARRAGA